MSSSDSKPATDVVTAAGSKGTEAAGGVAGAIAKEREARGAGADGEADAKNTHAQDHDITSEHGAGTGVAN